MQRDLGDLLTADAVAQYLGLRPTTIYQWCRQGRLPALKLGKEWRIRQSALQTFLEQSERRPTLTAQLGAFLTVPDDVLAIAENRDFLHRLDAAFFQVGEARGALLIKFTGGEPDLPLDALRAALTARGLAVAALEAAGQMHFIPSVDPLGGRAQALRMLLASEAAGGRLLFVDFNWTAPVDLSTVMAQQGAMAAAVDGAHLVMKSALLQEITDEWLPAIQREAQERHAGVIWLGKRGLGLRRLMPLPPQ